MTANPMDSGPISEQTPAGQPCSECGQHFSFCRLCSAPTELRSRSTAFVLAGACLIVLTLLVSYLAACVRVARDPTLLAAYLGKEPGATWQILANMGDTFGGLNCIVSALAFAGLIYGIAQQRTELKYQRQAMTEARKEMRVSVQAQVDSARALALQIKHMRLTAAIDALGAMLSSFDAQVVSKLQRIAEAEPVADQAKLAKARQELRSLEEKRDQTLTNLNQALRQAAELQQS